MKLCIVLVTTIFVSVHSSTKPTNFNKAGIANATAANQFTYVASIIRPHNTFYKKKNEWICQSPIIAPFWILSHSACVGHSYSSYYAIAGTVEVDQIENSLLIAINNYQRFNDLSLNTKGATLILLLLQRSIVSDSVRPVALLRKLPEQQPVTIVGDLKLFGVTVQLFPISVSVIDQRLCKEKIKEECVWDYELAHDSFCTDQPRSDGLPPRVQYYPGSPVEIRPGVIVAIADNTQETIDHCPGVHLNVGKHEEFITELVQGTKWVDY